MKKHIQFIFITLALLTAYGLATIWILYRMKWLPKKMPSLQGEQRKVSCIRVIRIYLIQDRGRLFGLVYGG